MIDINDFGLDVHDRTAFPHEVYVNRVYPSEAMASHNNIRFMLEIVRHLEHLNIPIINPFTATYTDYSKTEAVSLLVSQNIPTPSTLLFANKQAALNAGKTMQFPKIVKMDCGGKARNVHKANTYAEYEEIVTKLDHEHQLIHVEDFLVTDGFTTRLVALGYEVVHISKRTLSHDWLGNMSVTGSSLAPYPHPPRALYELGEAAARVLQAPIVSFDVAETADGSYILDVNTTPVFTPQSAEHLGFRPEAKMAEIILA